MSSIYVYREQAYPDIYEQRPFHPPTIIAQVKQDAYTFRPRSIQTPELAPGRSLQGKPKLSIRAHKSPHYTADAPPTQTELKLSNKPVQPLKASTRAIEELRNMLIYQDELRRAQYLKNDNEMKQIADLPEEYLDEAHTEILNHQAGSGYRYHKPPPINQTTQKGKGKGKKDCYTVVAEEKDGKECYTVMTGGKKTNSIQEIENAITILKGAGYRLFKSKLAKGFKQVRKSRAKQQY
jgi:hypothetical protein